jgi:hypothetical protein
MQQTGIDLSQPLRRTVNLRQSAIRSTYRPGTRLLIRCQDQHRAKLVSRTAHPWHRNGNKRRWSAEWRGGQRHLALPSQGRRPDLRKQHATGQFKGVIVKSQRYSKFIHNDLHPTLQNKSERPILHLKPACFADDEWYANVQVRIFIARNGELFRMTTTQMFELGKRCRPLELQVEPDVDAIKLELRFVYLVSMQSPSAHCHFSISSQ